MTKVIAEIGCNHKGDLVLAKRMVGVAAACGAWGVKFQKRDPKVLLTEAEYNAPHPNPSQSYGDTYGAHREALELSYSAHMKLKAAANAQGMAYGCSVWDMPSAQGVIHTLKPDFVKIPSAMATNKKLVEYVASYSAGAKHISLGMCNSAERKRICMYVEGQTDRDSWVVYHCTSAYPIEPDDAHLFELEALQAYDFAIGYSGHHLGIALDVAAATLGAGYIERHFTLDRTWVGTDQAASLEPSGLSKLVRDLRAVDLAMSYRPEGVVLCEKPQIEKLKWNPKRK